MILDALAGSVLSESADQFHTRRGSNFEDGFSAQLEGFGTDGIVQLVVELMMIVGTIMPQLSIRGLRYGVEREQVDKSIVVNEEADGHLSLLQQVQQTLRQAFLLVEGEVGPKFFWF